MASDNKASADITINIEGQNQINNSVRAFDGLRQSINALSSPFNTLSGNLNSLTKNLSKYSESLNKLKEEQQNVAASGDKASEKLSIFSNTFSNIITILEAAKIAVKGWALALTGGLSVLITFAPELIKIVSGFLKGNDAIGAMVENLKNLNAIMKTANQDAAAETTRLQILYRSATDLNNTYDKRIKSVQEMKREYPNHLKNISDEDILNGKAKKTYDELSKSIMENAKAKAALNKITEQATKALDADFQIQKIQNANYNEKYHKTEEYNARLKSGRFALAKSVLDDYKKESDERAQIAIDGQKKIKKEAEDSIKFMESVAGGANKIADAISGDNAGDDHKEKASKRNREYYEAQLTEQQTLLDQLDARAKDFEKKAKPITARINQTKRILAGYDGQKENLKIKASFKTSSAIDPELDEDTKWQARSAALFLENYAQQIEETNTHFDKLKTLHNGEDAQIIEIEKQHVAALAGIKDKFQKSDLEKLDTYQKELTIIAEKAGKTAEELAIAELNSEENTKTVIIDKAREDSKAREISIQEQLNKAIKDKHEERAGQLRQSLAEEQKIQAEADSVKMQLHNKTVKDIEKINSEVTDKKANETEAKAEKNKEGDIQHLRDGGHNIKALNEQQTLLDMQYKAAIDAAKKTGKATADIEAEYAAKKKAVEEQLVNAKIHAGDKYIDAVLKNTNKDTAIYKAAFVAKKATAIADVIISTKKSLIASFEGYASLPFIGQALAIAQGAFIAGQAASSIAQITKQKPGFAQGGQFRSDGRGALLSGYSRTDDTNAYLRSGEAVVVSEAMRNPWARNLVSAINVAHGGRDFSMSNPGRGYAIGGVFTDGGNANRYYSAPANDVKDLANTLAYQMINNFPPIYVDVKDVNNQQNILAQTVNRVNL